MNQWIENEQHAELPTIAEGNTVRFKLLQNNILDFCVEGTVNSIKDADIISASISAIYDWDTGWPLNKGDALELIGQELELSKTFVYGVDA